MASFDSSRSTTKKPPLAVRLFLQARAGLSSKPRGPAAEFSFSEMHEVAHQNPVLPDPKPGNARVWLENCVLSEHNKCEVKIYAAENMISALNNKDTVDLTIAKIKEMYPDVQTIDFIVYFESGMIIFDLPHILRTLDVYFGLKDEQLDEYYVTKPAMVITVFMKKVIEEKGHLPDGVYMFLATTATVPVFFVKVGTVDTITYSVNILKATAYDFHNHKFINMLSDISESVFRKTHMPAVYNLYNQTIEHAVVENNTKLIAGELKHYTKIDEMVTEGIKLEEDHNIAAMRAKHQESMKRQRERQAKLHQEHQGTYGLGFGGEGKRALAAAEEPAFAAADDTPVADVSEVVTAEVKMATSLNRSLSLQSSD